MKNKKIITGVSAVLFGISLLIPSFAASAEETAPKYTFDELLTMSDEEICAISDEYADSFASAENAYSYYTSRLGTFTTMPFHITFYEDNYTVSDMDKLIADLPVPSQLIENARNSGTVESEGAVYTDYIIKYSYQDYNGYDKYDVFTRAYTALKTDDNTRTIMTSAIAGGGGANPEYTEPAVTTEATFPSETSTAIELTTDTTTTTIVSTMAIAAEEETQAPTTKVETTKKQQSTTTAKPSPNDSPKTGDKGVRTALSFGILALASFITAKKRK